MYASRAMFVLVICCCLTSLHATVVVANPCLSLSTLSWCWTSLQFAGV